MIEIPHGVAQGHWHRFGPHIWIRCPLCNFSGALDHDVANDGTVIPSVECPREGCTFHDTVKLLDWPK